MTTKIDKKTFSGTSKVFDGTLAIALMSLLQFNAATALAAGNVTALTDSSGGTANGTISPIGTVTPALLGTADCAQKAGIETAFGTVRDGVSEIVAKLNSIRAFVPAYPALTDSTGGAAADGTIGAITVALTGVGTSMASAAGTQAVIEALKNAVSQARYFVNQAAVAVGVAPVIDKSGHVGPTATTFAAISTSTGTAVNGLTLLPANAAVKEVDAETVLVALREAIAELAAKVNAVADVTPTLAVVAG